MHRSATSWLRGEGPFAVPRFVWLLLLVDALLGLAYLGDRALGQPILVISHQLDLDREANLPTWWSAVQLFSAAALLFAIADARVSRRDRRSWLLWLLPLVFLAFSIDETIQLHEFVGVQTDALLPSGTRVSTLFSETGLFFLVVGVPAAILVGVLLAAVRPFLRVPEGAFRKVVIAVSMMFIGAVAVDFLANFVEVRSAPALVLVYVEESLEMAGASVMLWAGHALVAAPVSPRDG